MNDNQKMIEEAKHLIEQAGSFREQVVHHAVDPNSMVGLWLRTADSLNAVLAVFEKAHTPTDDERAEILRIYERCWESWNLEALPRVEEHDTFSSYLAAELSRAGFRRFEASEPSATWYEDPDGDTQITGDEWQKLSPEERDNWIEVQP